jgi:hypothetical protein
MKISHLYLTLLIIFVIGCSSVKDGIKTTYYKDGQINQEWNYQANIFHKYYENGTLQTEGKLEKGKGEGLWKSYYGSGNLFQEFNLKNGKWNGPCKQYYENGLLLSEGEFDMDKPIGVTLVYFPNGKIHQQFDYNNRRYKEFTEQGDVLVEKDI